MICNVTISSEAHTSEEHQEVSDEHQHVGEERQHALCRVPLAAEINEGP
jgi:hypothetical protein